MAAHFRPTQRSERNISNEKWGTGFDNEEHLCQNGL